MIKKIIGICLLVLGGVLFLWTSYRLVKNLTTTREELITLFDEKGMSSYVSEEQIEKMINDSIPPLMIVMLIAAGIAFGGFTLFKRGKKDEQLPNTFKF